MAALLKAKTTERSGDGSDVLLRALLSGSLNIADFVTTMSFRGNVYTVQAGLVTTPVTWVDTDVIDVTKALLFGSIPSDKAIIPVELWLYMEAFGSSQQFECDAVIGTGGSRTSGGTSRTAVNARSDIGGGSGVVWFEGGNSLITVGSTSKINRFWRDGKQFAITKTAESATVASFDPVKFGWSIAQNGGVYIAGPDSEFAMHFGSETGTGFAGLTYVEFPKSWLPT